jgi:hypothetical protein
LRKKSFCAVTGFDVIGKSNAACTQGFELFAALGHQLIIVNGRGGGGVMGQGVGCGHRAAGKELIKKRVKGMRSAKVLILGFKAGF